MPNRIRELRLQRRLTQEELGKLVDLDQTEIARIERDLRTLDAQRIEKFARVFKVQPWELFISPESLEGGDNGELNGHSRSRVSSFRRDIAALPTDAPKGNRLSQQT